MSEGAGAPAVILLAHGARDPRWAEPFLRVASLVGALAPDLDVELAYLEHLEPTLEEAVRRLAERGVDAIRIVPLFVGRGGHLRVDVPRRAAAAAAAARVAIDVAPPAGDDDAVQQALAAFCVRAGRAASRTA